MNKSEPTTSPHPAPGARPGGIERRAFIAMKLNLKDIAYIASVIFTALAGIIVATVFTGVLVVFFFIAFPVAVAARWLDRKKEEQNGKRGE